MSDLPDRDDLEKRLSRALSPLFKRQMGKLLELMGDPPDLSKVPDSFWKESTDEFTRIVRPFLNGLFADQAQRLIESLPVGVDWTLVNERAANWAAQYTYDLVSKINDTSRTLLQNTVSRYFRDGLTIGELQDQLMGAFGPVRAEMIAVTEVTRASTQGEHAVVEEVRAQGIHMREIYNTNNDELVCEICAPMNQKEVTSEDERPPLHPRCRCWINSEIIIPEATSD